jgi:fatty-acid desaturase
MSNKKSRRSSRRHYHQAAGAVVQPINEHDVSELLSGRSPSEASKSLKWTSGKKATAKVNNINWEAAIWLTVVHAGAVFAPWTFTWSALALVVVLHWFCGGIGICLGFHRLLTHGSFSTQRWMRRAIATAGCLAGEGPPMQWVANHRLHHARSDQEGDPHTPNEGGWWSHVFWLAYRVGGKDPNEFYRKWTPDLYQDRYMRLLNYLFLPLNVGLSLVIMAAGYAVGGWPLAISWLVWGVAVRMVFVLHSTWLVNSASHLWGYRNYETRDNSRNNWWVAFLTYGEGWHNNHHAHPRMARHGHRWWEIDLTFLAIRLMRVLGVAWDVVDYRNRSEKGDQATV